MKHEDCRQVML